MRGASSFVVLSALFTCALIASPARAGDGDPVRTLAREKAAAVSLLKAKGARQVATMAQDRVFIAYLNASTQGQGARLRSRMVVMFTTLWNRFGLRDVALVDRAGELVVRVGHAPNAPTSYDVKRDPVLSAGLKQKQFEVATIAGADGLTYAAPVIWREQAEFVLSARQSFAAYRKVLARGTASDSFVVLVDAKGQILADTRNGPAAGTRAKLVAGLSLEGLRKAVKGSRDEGAGEIARGNERFRVRYLSVGDWTVIAGASVAVPRRCPGAGTRLCG
jgi:hypothetical protein